MIAGCGLYEMPSSLKPTTAFVWNNHFSKLGSAMHGAPVLVLPGTLGIDIIAVSNPANRACDRRLAVADMVPRGRNRFSVGSVAWDCGQEDQAVDGGPCSPSVRCSWQEIIIKA